MPVYLDCNATTPIEAEVAEAITRFSAEEYGNAGSRTHDFGMRAKKAVEVAREHIGRLSCATPEEVIFTSGATESNNLAILGLERFARETRRMHIVTTCIEHKAVLEPIEELKRRGFERTLVGVDASGRVDPTEVAEAVREDTLLVSVMQVNNETGVIQPIEAIAKKLESHEAFFHVDAAQGFGKQNSPLELSRLDMISVSGHKFHGPKGIGALIARRRGFRSPPLSPLTFGGGQERGLRAGTLPVALIVGLGIAGRLAKEETDVRRESCLRFRERLCAELDSLAPVFVGDQAHVLHNTLCVRFPGIDAEAAVLAIKGQVAVSNGSACTSASYEPSHVLCAMGYSKAESEEAVRFSWCHRTPDPDWDALVRNLARLL